LKERKIYFGSQFQKYQSMVAWAEHHGSGRVWQGTAVHLMADRKQKEIGRGQVQDTPKDQSTVTYFLLLGLTS
jgi:hypothetical protein